MPGGGGITERGDLDATPSQPPRAGFRPATRGERARMEGKPPPDGPPMNKKEREAEAIAYALGLKEKKPEPGQIRSEFDLRRADALITHRDELTNLLCRVHNMASGHDFYITDDARDDGDDNFISMPSWLKTDIADALIRRIDETKERITKEFGIPQ